MAAAKGSSEWTSFKVGKPSSRSDWSEQDCRPFDFVSHIAHIKQAWEILDSGMIKANLIRDESKLNKYRIEVAWFSPNDWNAGSRYGNVSFQRNWQDLLESVNYYWVESIAYGIPAARILFSERDLSKILEPYDPTLRDGPWWYDQKNGIHYRNGKITLEFMFETGVRIDDTDEISFVKHHQHQCSIDKSNCPDKGVTSTEAGVFFLSGMICRNIHSKLICKSTLHHSVINASRYLYRKIVDLTDVYSGKNGYEQRRALAIGIMCAISQGRDDQAKALASMFYDEDSLLSTCQDLLVDYFKCEEMRFERI